MHREDFPILESGIIYFDNGATTLKPKCLIEKTVDYYSNYSANAHRGDYNIASRVDDEYNLARKKVADFINANKSEIVFTSGTTDSINIIVDGYFKSWLKANDEILLTYAEHASNVLPWFKLVNEIGVKVKFIPLNESLEVTLDNVKNSITNKTKVLSLAHITNVLGDIRPIKEICEYAHEMGIKVVVDGAQSLPHISVDVSDLDVDFYVASFHKMLGPTGVGILYGKKELLDETYPHNLGGGMNESFDTPESIYLKTPPIKFEAGTQNIAGIIGIIPIIDYLNKIGMNNIHEHEINLKKYFLDKVKEIEHIKVVNPNTTSGIISFNIDGVFSQDVAYFLNKYNICVRAGNHCAKILKNEIGIKNTVRVSFYLYNTYEEVDKLIELLKDKEKIVREMI